MSDSDSKWGAATLRAEPIQAIDVGLRAHMIRVYNYMAAGVALTGMVAWLTFNMAATVNATGKVVLTPIGQQMFGTWMMWVLMLAPLGLVFFISFMINRLSAGTARTLFFIYAGSLGLSLATIFMVYTLGSITRVFFISAASFGALSLYGYTTKRDLSGLGSFMMMGLFGIILASLVNLIFRSPMMDWIISVAGVLVFAGLTAWDTQRIKEMYDPYDDAESSGRKAVMGALELYLDFINLFLSLLRLFGERR